MTPEQVQAFDKKLEDMSNQVLQWQKQHQADLQMLASKEKQLKGFQEEMMALKKSLVADDKEVGTPHPHPGLPDPSSLFLLAHPMINWTPKMPEYTKRKLPLLGTMQSSGTGP